MDREKIISILLKYLTNPCLTLSIMIYDTNLNFQIFLKLLLSPLFIVTINFFYSLPRMMSCHHEPTNDRFVASIERAG